MEHIIDLARYPLDMPETEAYADLVSQAQGSLAAEGLFNLPGFLKAEALEGLLTHSRPLLESASFEHARWHNIYFKDHVDGLAPDDPALAKVKTTNHTICHDQLLGTALDQIYRWAPFARFIADVMEQPELHQMDDPLAGVNVMEYRDGEALNWHFDRSVFTITILLQEAEQGGLFEYAKDLRSDDDPNYAGVAELVAGRLEPTVLQQDPGTLNVFLGKNTAHRVTPVSGTTSRIVNTMSFYPEPGVAFTEKERVGFYGRVG